MTNEKIFSNNSQSFLKMVPGAIQDQSILEIGRNKGKLFVKKILLESDYQHINDKNKFKNLWIAKQQSAIESINETISADLFSFFMGDGLSPKYRLAKDENGEIWSLSKLLNNFTPALKLFDSRGDSSGNEYNELHNNITSQLENYNHMIAIAILFGKDDMHEGNWGIVEKDGKKNAAIIDHGQALNSYSPGIFMNNVMTRYGHRKEQIVTKEFAQTCMKLIEDFESEKDKIKNMLEMGIKRVNEFYPKDVQTIDYYMQQLEINKKSLEQISYQISAEIAILEGNTKNLHLALEKMDGKFLTLDEHSQVDDFFPLSKQNIDGKIDRAFGESFIHLIKTRLQDDFEETVFDKKELRLRGKYVVNKEYTEKMTPKDKEIENALLKTYYTIAKAKQSLVIDTSNILNNSEYINIQKDLENAYKTKTISQSDDKKDNSPQRRL